MPSRFQYRRLPQSVSSQGVFAFSPATDVLGVGSVDLTMQIETAPHDRSGSSPEVDASDVENDTHLVDEERAFPRASSQNGNTVSQPSHSSHTLGPDDGDVTELRTRPNSLAESTAAATGGAANFIKRKTSQLLDVISSGSTKGDIGPAITPQLATLIQAYMDSDIAKEIRADIEAAGHQPEHIGEPDATQLRNVTEESSDLRGRRRASYATQFRILSGRAFKNLYRNPALLAAHYISSIGIARELDLTSHHRVVT